MSDVSGAAGQPRREPEEHAGTTVPGEERDKGAGAGAPLRPDTEGGIPLGPEAQAELDEATRRVYSDDQTAETQRLASEEIGLSTDLASNQPHRRFEGT